MHVNMTVDYVRQQHRRWLKYVQQRRSQKVVVVALLISAGRRMSPLIGLGIVS
jgi:hypothetical protein